MSGTSTPRAVRDAEAAGSADVPAGSADVLQARPSRHPGRAIAGYLGELLMTLGVLVLLFVAWQLLWTDVESNRVQDAQVHDLSERFEQSGSTVPPTPGIPDPTATGLISAETTRGTTFAVMYIPKFGADYRRPVVQGTEAPELALGIGHVESSVMPGQIGNFATAGHRVTYGKPYNRIDMLEKGDVAVVETSDGWSIYRYVRSRIVAPDQVEVLAPVPDAPGATPTEAWMTMVACHPKFSAAQRYIGYLRLERFVPRTTKGVPPTVQRALRVPTGAA